MSLNQYRDEAEAFVKAIGVEKEDLTKLLSWLSNEVNALTKAAIETNQSEVSHQIYDVLFLLMELAGRFDVDLDAEWSAGQERKQVKYVRRKNYGD